MEQCRFKDNWSAMPDTAVRIVSTKPAEKKVTSEFLANHHTISFTAIDMVKNSKAWELAGPRVKKQLNHKCYEYNTLHLYMYAIVRMTYNDRQGNFSHGQIAVVLELPTANENVRNISLKLRLAPHGTRHIHDVTNLPDDWPLIIIKAQTSPNITVGPSVQMGHRIQLGVRFYIASTIHRVQGDTFPLVATQITDSSKEFRLWQKEQLAVLVSRVSQCQDIIFVGDREETRRTLERILVSTITLPRSISCNISSKHSPRDKTKQSPLSTRISGVASGRVWLCVSCCVDDMSFCLSRHSY